ncbi:hypothetical protein B9Z55_010969 [Caenorhabditis nigoni]|uniref:Sdz-33 F-box domain-containing protein n=1 Tax=Caenorhabditis nigoni TaxID=1611254 RepID=A0A2G5UJ23_9PELO|nr:hypothetical protein B9Z55_010969 [Caenorhabditis nigoni]
MSEEKEATIELNELGDALNEIEKLSPEERFQLLTNFIGGFEKWDQLNEDCRLHVAQFLDYKSMCNLERCSKQDQKTVKDAPIRIFSAEIVQLDNEYMGDRIEVTVRFGFTEDNYELSFSQDRENVERVCVVKRRRKIMIVESSNYCQEAVNFAEKMIRKGQNQLEELRVCIKKYPFENSQMRSLPHCKTARLGVMSKDEMWWWLKWLPKDNLDIWISPYEKNAFTLILSSEELNCQQFRNAEQLTIIGRVDYTNEQFLNLKLKDCLFDSIGVTDEIINQFIKNWINGVGCLFERMYLGSMEDRKVAEILRGIQFREWNQNFKDEISITNKVDPYESITLEIPDTCKGLLCLYHTGKRATSLDGDNYTFYTFPHSIFC